MLMFYLLLAVLGAAMDFILYRYVTMLPMEIIRVISAAGWLIILLAAVIVIPHYFIHAKIIITKNEIATAGGFITYKNDYMPISSIKSISVVITPLGTVTGFNFVIVNSLGARMVLCFLKKKDVIAISKNVNELILGRDN